jgi:hypothetical protein
MHSLPAIFPYYASSMTNLKKAAHNSGVIDFCPFFRFGLSLGVVFREFLVRNQDLFYQKFFPVSCKTISTPALLGQCKGLQIVNDLDHLVALDNPVKNACGGPVVRLRIGYPLPWPLAVHDVPIFKIESPESLEYV